MTWTTDLGIAGYDRDDSPVYAILITPVEERGRVNKNSLDEQEAAEYINLLERSMENAIEQWRDYSTSLLSNEDRVKAFIAAQHAMDSMAEILSTDALTRVKATMKEQNQNATETEV